MKLSNVQAQLRGWIEREQDRASEEEKKEWQALWDTSRQLFVILDKKTRVEDISPGVEKLELAVDKFFKPPTEQSEAAQLPTEVKEAGTQWVLESVMEIQSKWLELHQQIISKHPIAVHIPAVQAIKRQADVAKDLMQQLSKLGGL